MDTLNRKIEFADWTCAQCKVDVSKDNHAPGCPVIPEKEAGGAKLSNPKDMIGSDKVPMSLVPATTKAYLAIGHLEGMLKYGLVNWREAGVRVSIYLDALERHLAKWQNGEWRDEKTTVPHLANAIACLSIIIDAYECGKLVDDRPKQAPVTKTIDDLTVTVKHLKSIFGDCNPKHYTHEADGPNTDLHDGTTEKREVNDSLQVGAEASGAYCKKGRYPISPTRSTLPKTSGTFRESDQRCDDTQFIPVRTQRSDLRRDELQSSDEGLPQVGSLAYGLLRNRY